MKTAKKNGGVVGGNLNDLVQNVPDYYVVLEYFRRLPDRDKLLLSAFDAFVAAFDSQEFQDALRNGVGDYDLSNIPADMQFLAGVKYAAAGIGSA